MSVNEHRRAARKDALSGRALVRIDKGPSSSPHVPKLFPLETDNKRRKATFTHNIKKTLYFTNHYAESTQ